MTTSLLTQLSSHPHEREHRKSLSARLSTHNQLSAAQISINSHATSHARPRPLRSLRLNRFAALLPAHTALAQGFAAECQVFSPPQGTLWGNAHLSVDGKTVGGGLFIPNVTRATSYKLNTTRLTQISPSLAVIDVSDNGAYTVGYARRRSAAGVLDVFSPSIVSPPSVRNPARISGNGQIVARSR